MIFFGGLGLLVRDVGYAGEGFLEGALDGDHLGFLQLSGVFLLIFSLS